MKVLPFKVPKTHEESFKVQVENDKHFYSLLHSHPEIQITYIIEGKGTLLVGDYLGNFKPGELYIIGSGQPHVFKNDPEYFRENSALKSYCVSVFIHNDIFGQQFMQLPEIKPLKEFIQRTGRGLAFGADVARRVYPLMRDIEKKDGLEKLITLLKILQIIAPTDDVKYLATVTNHKTFNEKEGKRLNYIYQFLMNESHRQVTLEEIAGLANLTPNAFCRYFRKHTGKSFTRFLNEVRVGNASIMLQNSSHTIADICYQSGFNNLSNFNRQFKSITGKLPKEFRKKAVGALNSR